MEFLRKLVVNWKTTIAGIIAAINVAMNQLFFMFDTDALTNPDWTIFIAQLSIAVGLILARDMDKSSEDTGMSLPVNQPRGGITE